MYMIQAHSFFVLPGMYEHMKESFQRGEGGGAFFILHIFLKYLLLSYWTLIIFDKELKML